MGGRDQRWSPLSSLWKEGAVVVIQTTKCYSVVFCDDPRAAMNGPNITTGSLQRHNVRTSQFCKSPVADIKLLSGTTESEDHYSIKFAAVQCYTMGQVKQISCFKAYHDCLQNETKTSCPQYFTDCCSYLSSNQEQKQVLEIHPYHTNYNKPYAGH